MHEDKLHSGNESKLSFLSFALSLRKPCEVAWYSTDGRMANNEFLITDIVGEKAFNDLSRLQGELRDTATLYASFAQEIANASKSSPKTFDDLAAKADGFTASLARLNDAGERMGKTQREQLAVLKQVWAQLNSVGSLNKLSTLMEQLTKNVQGASEALARLSANASASGGSQQQAAQGAQQASQAMAQAQQSLKGAETGYANLTKTIMGYNSEVEELATANARHRIEMDSVSAAMKKVEKAFKGGDLSADAYARQMGELKLQYEQLKQATQQNSALIRNHATAVVSASGSYYEMNAAMLELQKRFKALGDAERNSPMGQRLVKQANEINAKLKEIDAQFGNYQRNVGNYASHWNGLGMSIQQIGRELPSLAMGWNTFFLAISNNLPILTDELARAKREYRDLTAQGQKATPVWRQVVSSIFSWQTALTVGITLLSVYGKEIMGWISGLFGADEAHKKLNESVREFNTLVGESRTKARLLYESIRESGEGTRERAEAIRQFNDEYGKYLSSLVSENDSLLEIGKAYKEVNKALMENAALKAKQSAIDKVLEEGLETQSAALAKIQESVGPNNARLVTETIMNWTEEYRQAGMSWQQAWNDIAEYVRKRIGKVPEDFYTALDDYVKSVYSSNREIENIQEQYNPFFNEKQANEAETRNKKYWERQRALLVSQLESLSDLEAGGEKGIRLRLEISGIDSKLQAFSLSSSGVKSAEEYAAYIKKITEDLNKTRIELMEEGRMKEMAEIRADYDARMAEITGQTEEEIELRKNLEALKQKALKEVDEKYAKEMLEMGQEDLENRLAAIAGNSQRELDERLRLQLELNGMMRDAELAEAGRSGADTAAIISKYEKEKNDIVMRNLEERFGLIQGATDAEVRELELAALKERNALKKQYAEGTISREEYEEGLNGITVRFSKQRLQAMMEEARQQLALANLTDEQRKDLEMRLEELQAKLDALGTSEGAGDASEKAREMEEALRLMEQQMSESLGESSDLLMGVIDLFKELTREGEKSAVAIVASVMRISNGLASLMSDIYQARIDALDEEQEANEEAYDKEVERIEALQERGAISTEEAEARKRAAEDKTKQKEQQIARQKAQLEEKQARWDKANSIIQATIATALAVTKVLPNFILAAVVAAMGAAQIAIISAQQVPKYAKGTKDHPGGLAIVGDGGRPEGIVTERGVYVSPGKPTLVNLPRHARVIPDLSAITSTDGLRSDYGLLEKQLKERREAGVTVNVDNDFSPLERGMRENTRELKDIRRLMRKQGVRGDFGWMYGRV